MRIGLLLSLASALAARQAEPPRKRSRIPVAVSVAFGFLAIAGALYLTYSAYEWLRIDLGAPVAALIAGVGALVVAAAVFMLVAGSGKPKKPERQQFDLGTFSMVAANVDRMARQYPALVAASLFALGVLQGLSQRERRRAL
jgi:hypothetical protein